MAASAVKHMYDALTAFRAPGSATITATASSDVVALDKITKGRGDVDNQIGSQSLSVAGVIESIDSTTGDEAYVLTLETDNDVVVATLAVTKVGAFVMTVDTDTVTDADPAALSVHVKATLSGTTPILGYSAWLVPTVK